MSSILIVLLSLALMAGVGFGTSYLFWTAVNKLAGRL